MSATASTAPECCPFCGSARKPGCGFRWFECGTMTAPADDNRRDQTPTCATAERERLTRERDEARAQLETSRQRSAEKDLRIEDLKTLVYFLRKDLSMRLNELEGVEKERDEANETIRLQHELIKSAERRALQKGQEECDQLLARVKRLEEALGSIREYWNRDNNEKAMEDACWHAIHTAAEVLKAKEATP